FRILVMGRANVGKTTILQRVCNTTDQPEIFDGKGEKVSCVIYVEGVQRGYHNIEDELVFRSSPGFVFHDSCGFEAGSEEEFNRMKEFVIDRAKVTKLDKRIHAIWYCIPLNEIHRMVMTAETKFFDSCDTGNVPVILLATKADTLELEAFMHMDDEGLSVDDAGVTRLQGKILTNNIAKLKDWLGNTRFPPHDYLSLTGMQQEHAECTPLLTCTANALKEEGLQQLLLSTQVANLELCMKFAIMK
ncbi:GTP-binding protein, partial [Pisolithus croceorrhizus]